MCSGISESVCQQAKGKFLQLRLFESEFFKYAILNTKVKSLNYEENHIIIDGLAYGRDSKRQSKDRWSLLWIK